MTETEFSYRATSGGTVLIAWHGRTVRDPPRAARRFLASIAAPDPDEQLLLGESYRELQARQRTPGSAFEPAALRR